MRSHKSILAWQEARAVVLSVIKLSLSQWRPHLAGVYGQLQRSSVSVMVNISEGYGWMNTATFTRHLRIAYGSALETADLLEVLQESGSVPPNVVSGVIASSGRCQRLLLGMLKRRFPYPPLDRLPLTVHRQKSTGLR